MEEIVLDLVENVGQIIYSREDVMRESFRCNQFVSWRLKQKHYLTNNKLLSNKSHTHALWLAKLQH
jgi:hypothetical protein